MKKALVFCLLMTALFFSRSVEAKILRVAYSGPAVAGVDYPNVQAAVNAAAVDDTIQLYQNASVGLPFPSTPKPMAGLPAFNARLDSEPKLPLFQFTNTLVIFIFNWLLLPVKLDGQFAAKRLFWKTALVPLGQLN